MSTEPRKLIAAEPDAYRLAAAIIAGIIPADAHFGAVREDGALSGQSAYHLSNSCKASGDLISISAAEVVAMFEDNALGNEDQALCWACTDIIGTQHPKVVFDYDENDLSWLTGAYRLTRALDNISDVPDIVKVVGEAHLILAQYQPVNPDLPLGRTVMEAARDTLAATLAGVTDGEDWWTGLEADLLANAGGYEWQLVNVDADRFDLYDIVEKPEHWYNELCALFAGGATIETTATNSRYQPAPVIRYRAGIVEGPEFGHIAPIVETAGSADAIRIGFETADVRDLHDDEKARAWFAAVTNACTATA